MRLLMERGFGRPGDVESRLGHHVGQLGRRACEETRIRMSHHASGPNFTSPRGDARLDMTDLYAFPKPGDPGKSILIFNVHPSVGVNPPGPTTAEPFAPGALYDISIDTNHALGPAIA